METKSKTTTKKRPKKLSKDNILEAYISYVLEQGEQPPSVFQFMNNLKGNETDFYDHFGSFKAIPKLFWSKVILNTLKTCQKDSNWTEYSSRDKLLAFFFTMVENLKQNRSFAIYTLRDFEPRKGTIKMLEPARMEFKNFTNEILNAGFESEEVLERPVISKRYNEILWLQFLFIVHFWKNDDSTGFENSDAAIEKSVNLAFELLGKSTIDSMLDFGKFLLNTSLLKK